MIHKWKFINRKILLDHPRMKIVEDTVTLPDNKEISYIREEPASSHSVAIIAINNDGKILLQREYSYPPDKVMYQLPGGGAKSLEDVTEAANRELSEESGYVGGTCHIVGSFYLNNRRSDRKQYVVVCKDLIEQKRNEDEEEFIESEWRSLNEIRALVRRGEIENVNLLAALSLLELQTD